VATAAAANYTGEESCGELSSQTPLRGKVLDIYNCQCCHVEAVLEQYTRIQYWKLEKTF
jgi:hypothetical protein